MLPVDAGVSLQSLFDVQILSDTQVLFSLGCVMCILESFELPVRYQTLVVHSASVYHFQFEVLAR